MKKFLTLAAISLAFVVTACNDNKPVIDSSNVTIPADTQKRYDTAKIGNIIAETAAHRGYSVQKAGAGTIKVQLLNRNTGAVTVALNIRYTHSTYGITADDSKQPNDPALVARYTNSLRRDIDKKLSMAAYQ